MFRELTEINKKPKAYEFYTAKELWTDPYIAKKMLEYHLNESVDAASRNSTFVTASIKWIIQKFNIDKDSDIIDFGCGPGLYTLPLAKTGAKVTGIDFSENSLAFARKNAEENKLNINYEHENYLDYNTEQKFDLITMIMCDFTALSPLQRKNILQKFRLLLKPKGSILLDVYSLEYFDSRQEKALYEFNQMNNFWSNQDYYSFLSTFKYNNEKVVLDKYTIYTEKEKKEVYNWAQCYTKESIIREFNNSGLIIEEFYSDVAGKDYTSKTSEFAVVAKIMNDF